MYNRFKCCICNKEFKGYGNNPYPFMDNGICCDACNYLKVIPLRMRLVEEEKKDE